MLTYLTQMIVCSGILFGYYYLFLRNEKFHAYNRFYLLAALLLSILLPLLKIPVELSQPDNSPVYAFVSTGDNIVISASKSFSWLNLLYWAYTLLTLLFILKLVLSIRKIYRLKADSEIEDFEDFSFIKTIHQDAPFSFFNWLFWNSSTAIESAEGQHIFKHELYHIRSKHSWDVIFVETILCLFWFNPFFYLYRKEIKTIQEFLADKHATEHADVNEYAELLVYQAAGIKNKHLVNPFFHQQLKRRIAMLLSSKKPRHQWLKKVLVLPLAAISIILFAFTYKKTTAGVSKHQDEPIAFTTNNNELTDRNSTETAEQIPPILNSSVQVGDTVPIKKTNREPEIFIKVGHNAEYPGDWTAFLMRNLNGKVALENGAPSGKYTVIIQFIVDLKGELSDIKPLTNIGYGMEEEAMRAIKKSGLWRPAIQDGRDVKSYRKQPITFIVDKTEKGMVSGVGILDEEKVTQQIDRDEPVFTKVEIDAEYPGDWATFLARNLDGTVAINNGAPAGRYTTIIQFIVDKNGNVTDIKPLTKIGYGMEDEAVRAIKKSGKWKPAMQNDRIVKAYKKQPITFEIIEVKKNKADS